jgi:hypothetical protein
MDVPMMIDDMRIVVIQILHRHEKSRGLDESKRCERKTWGDDRKRGRDQSKI